MNSEKGVSFATLVQTELDGDEKFQASLTDLDDDKKAEAISKKREELYEAKYSSLKSEKEKADELATNYKTRAEKAEKGKKGDDETPNKPSKEEGELSRKDWLKLAKADVHEEDIEEVVEYATFKKISVADALKSSVVKQIIADKAEARKTAEATARKGGGPVSGKKSDGQVLKDAREGNVPEPGTPEAEALFRARHGLAEDRKV